MTAKMLTALVERVTKAAVRGRTADGQEYFDMGAVSVSITHGHSGRLAKRAVLLCAVGPRGQESDIVAYDAMPSNGAVRRKVSEAVRVLVARVEGMPTADAGMVQ